MDIFTFILARNSAGGGGESVERGSARTPYTYIPVNPQFTVDGNLITAMVEESASVTPSVVPGYVSNGTAGTVEASGSSSVQASTLEPNLLQSNIKAGVTLFGVTGGYAGDDGGVVNGTVTVGKTNGYRVIVENALVVTNGIVRTSSVKRVIDGYFNCNIPQTQNPSNQTQTPYTLVIRPYNAGSEKITSVSGNSGGTAYVSYTVAYVPVYSGDEVYVNITDN